MEIVFLPDLSRNRKLFLFENHTWCFPARSEVCWLGTTVTGVKRMHLLQSLWNPDKIQAFVLVIIYAFRADHLIVGLLSPQRFYLYYVQWTFHRRIYWSYLFPGNKNNEQSEDAVAEKITLRLSVLASGNWILVLEKEKTCPSLTQPPWDAGCSSKKDVSKVLIPGAHRRPFSLALKCSAYRATNEVVEWEPCFERAVQYIWAL